MKSRSTERMVPAYVKVLRAANMPTCSAITPSEVDVDVDGNTSFRRV